MRDAAGQLSDPFHLLRLLRSLFGGPAFGQVARDLGKSHDVAFGISDRVDDDACPEPALVLANPPSLSFEFARLGGNGQSLCGDFRLSILLGVEGREMTAEDFLALVSLGPLRSGIPVDDVPAQIEHKDRVIRYAFDQQPEAPLGFLQLRGAGGQLCGALFDALFQSLIKLLQFLFSQPPCRDFAFAGVVKPRVVDGNRRLRTPVPSLGVRRER